MQGSGESYLSAFALLLHASPLQIGLLFTSYSLTQLVFAPLLGRLSDRVGRRPVLLFSITGSVAAYLLFRRVPPATTALVLVGAAVAVTPWLIRNEVNVGCFTLTTDGRAFWKANNPQTYALLSSGQWIDNVRRDSPRPPEPRDSPLFFR